MSISWGNLAVRVYAAEAWVSLASRFAAEHSELVDQLEIILGDSTPAVRLKVAERLQVIHTSAPERMWAMAERIATHETEQEIIVAYLNRSMWHLSHEEPDRCEAMLSIIIQRLDGDLVRSARARPYLLESLGGWAAQLFVGQGRLLARTWLEDWAPDPQRRGEMLGFFVSHLRAAFFERYSLTAEPDSYAVSDRAQESLELILRSAITASTQAIGAYASAAADTEKEAARDRYEAAEGLIHQAMSQLYFGSGAHGPDRDGGPGLPNANAMRRFLTDYRDILDLLGQAREPRTLHYLLELYKFLIPGDPVAVFVRIHAILLGRAEQEGYQYEALGNSCVVGIVQRYIADYRAIFEDDERRAGLVEILRLFSQAGWPEALKLLYDLPELLR